MVEEESEARRARRGAGSRVAPSRGGTERTGVVPDRHEPQRAGLLGRAALDGQAALERQRVGRGGRMPSAASSPADVAAAAVGQSLRCHPPSPSRGPSRPRCNVGILVLMVCGIALMYGSVGLVGARERDRSAASPPSTSSVNGIDPAISTLIGVNGWVTFIGGIVLRRSSAGFAMTSEEQVLAVFTVFVAAATMVFAIYDMFRIVQKISQVTDVRGSNVSVGWGLICVLSAAVLAMLDRNRAVAFQR